MVLQIYSKCGGKNYNGDKTCASGLSCAYKDEYYSQCVPNGHGFDLSGAEKPLSEIPKGQLAGPSTPSNPPTPPPSTASKSTTSTSPGTASVKIASTAPPPVTPPPAQAPAASPVPAPVVAPVAAPKVPASKTVLKSPVVDTVKVQDIQPLPSSPTVLPAEKAPELEPKSDPSSTTLIPPTATFTAAADPLQGLSLSQPAPVVSSAIPSPVDSQAKVHDSSLITGAIIGSSIGLIMFCYLAFTLYNRYRRRRAALSWDCLQRDEVFNPVGIKKPEHSYCNL